MIRKWLGKGVLGVGQRRGLFRPGEILILVYSPGENRVITVQSMRGYSIFARFKEKSEYSRLTLDELRRFGLENDRRDMGLWRTFFHYDRREFSKRKGALIQAVEAVDKHLAKFTRVSSEIPEPSPTAPEEPVKLSGVSWTSSAVSPFSPAQGTLTNSPSSSSMEGKNDG